MRGDTQPTEKRVMRRNALDDLLGNVDSSTIDLARAGVDPTDRGPTHMILQFPKARCPAGVKMCNEHILIISEERSEWRVFVQANGVCPGDSALATDIQGEDGKLPLQALDIFSDGRPSEGVVLDKKAAGQESSQGDNQHSL